MPSHTTPPYHPANTLLHVSGPHQSHPADSKHPPLRKHRLSFSPSATNGDTDHKNFALLPVGCQIQSYHKQTPQNPASPDLQNTPQYDRSEERRVGKK